MIATIFLNHMLRYNHANFNLQRKEPVHWWDMYKILHNYVIIFPFLPDFGFILNGKMSHHLPVQDIKII